MLRIKVNADGTYSIPSGNLFAPGTAKTRPEIYAMGFRNPFRFTVDTDGTIYMASPFPLGSYAVKLTERLEHWAAAGFWKELISFEMRRGREISFSAFSVSPVEREREKQMKTILALSHTEKLSSIEFLSTFSFFL
mgnify:CR=1 FL=1